MPVPYKLGKKSAVRTDKVVHFSEVASTLPAPPPNSDWYSRVSNWMMLGNDQWGDCAEAAAFHCLMGLSTYGGTPLVPTDEEVIKAYSEITGFDPNDPSTDEGTVLLGPGSLMHYWRTKGLTCGGKLNIVDSYMQIARPHPDEWMRAISTFGGLMPGVLLPENILAGDKVPDVWADYSGGIAGGHAIWLCGYETTPSGRLYDLISWGSHYKATEDFLLHVVDEAVAIYDSAIINAQGVDVGGLNVAQLESAMRELRHEG